MASVPGTPSHRYHPSYCEENVYWLCQELGAASAGDEEWFAVFVSNPSRQVQLTYGSGAATSCQSCRRASKCGDAPRCSCGNSALAERQEITWSAGTTTFSCCRGGPTH
jgi:hypothetical protein